MKIFIAGFIILIALIHFAVLIITANPGTPDAPAPTPVHATAKAHAHKTRKGR